MVFFIALFCVVLYYNILRFDGLMINGTLMKYILSCRCNYQVGTFADVVVADAIVKGIKGFDLNTAREAILKDVR